MSERQAARIKKLESQLRKERTKVKKLEKECNPRTAVQTFETYDPGIAFGLTSLSSSASFVMKLNGFEESSNRSQLFPDPEPLWPSREVSRTKPFTPSLSTATTEEDDDHPVY